MIKKAPVTVCITSGKGGVGKTSIAVNLAMTLAQKKYRVLVVDGDLGLANVDIFFGIAAKNNIKDIFDNKLDPVESIYYPYDRLGVLAAASGVPELVSLASEDQEELEQFIKTLVSDFDFTFIDTAAGIGSSVLWFNSIAGHIIVVVTSDPTSITDAYALIKVMQKKYNKQDFYITVNQIKNGEDAKKVFERLNQVTKRFLKVNLSYLGYVATDSSVADSIKEQTPFVKTAPNSRASKSLYSLAQRVLTL